MSQHGCPERLSNMSKGFQEEGASQPTMEVLVETLTGTVFEMTVSPSDTIFAIKSKIFRVEGIPVSQQHLVYNLRELEDSLSLREHAIADGARLRLVLGMRVGPIATRRLPPPPAADAWRDLDRLLDNNREDGEWVGGGCKVTVLVFREGERVNMLRVRENRDGTYSPLDHTKYSSCASPCGSRPAERATAPAENAVTAGKMLDLRRRMESLSVQRRRTPSRPGDKAEIQKTRSEETLSVPSLLDETSEEPFESRTYTPYSEAEDTFAPLYDGNYTRYDYDCSFADRYTFLPPIGSRTDSDQSVQEAVAESDRLKLTDALAGSILVKGGRRDGREEEAAILEECLDGASVEECHIRQDSPQLAAKNLAPIPAAEYGPLVGGESGWRARGFGSSSQLAAPAPLARAPPAHSASALQLRAPAPRHPPPRPAALSDALFSSSTSDLEHLTRNRLLPALSRHRNREHLHLSDEGLDSARTQNLDIASDRPGRIKKIAEFDSTESTKFANTPVEDKKETKEKTKRIRCGFCKKRLSIATVHKCRCGADFCAPHRYAEVHGCAYDYKANAHQYLERANPLVSAPKLPKI